MNSYVILAAIRETFHLGRLSSNCSSVQINLFQKLSVNPQNDERLFMNYKKNKSLEHVVYKNCFFVLKFKIIFVHNMF
jgi:hypothetical protein